MKISISFKWYDFWIGLHYDRELNILYFCPLPMICIKIILRGFHYLIYAENIKEYVGCTYTWNKKRSEKAHNWKLVRKNKNNCPIHNHSGVN